MARKNRRDIVNESEVGTYLLSSRTVRRAFLAGHDPITGDDRSYRKRVIEKRLEDLASVFAVEVLEYSTADNHSYVIVRNRPDLVATWTDRDVARRWLRVNRSKLKLEPEPSPDRIERFLLDTKKLVRARKALSSISEFMGCLKQPVAREANIRDHAQDNFWAGRFESQRLEDDVALTACSAYVNMNLVRAERARGIEDSHGSSANARWQDEAERSGAMSAEGQDPPRDDGEVRDTKRNSNEPLRSGWLAPVAVAGDGYDGASAGRRASNEGYLHMTLQQQREVMDLLLQFEGLVKVRQDEQLQPDLPAVMQRIGVNAEQWTDTVRALRTRFNRELKVMAEMLAEARQRGASLPADEPRANGLSVRARRTRSPET